MKAKLNFQLMGSAGVSFSSDQTSWPVGALRSIGTFLPTSLIVSERRLRVIKRGNTSQLPEPVGSYRFGARIYPWSRRKSLRRRNVAISISEINITLRSFLLQANPLRARSYACR